MNSGAVLTIDFAALAANYRRIRAQVAPAAVAGVVKADGYGLGAIEVARTLMREGCEHLFVALVGEASALIPALDGPASVYVLNGLLPGQEDECLAAGAIPVLNSLDQAQRWAATAARANRRLPAVVQVDTGMARMGMETWEIDAFLADPTFAERLDLRLVMSHLACGDMPQNPSNAQQYARMSALAERFAGVPVALDNSAGSFLPRGHFAMVRAGIAVYGGAPNDAPNPMAPVVALTIPIAQLRTIPAGAGVGYGLTFHTERETRIATIPMGYADGWPRCLGNTGSVFIAGTRVPIVGRVSMDSITLDVTDIAPEHLYPGAPVEILGPHQSIDDVARDAGTISYEILTQLSRRYHRIHLGLPEASTSGASAATTRSPSA
ncbi:alanine racemase [Novosphingobium sp. 1949]|uniref:Alanine racemase n=1 Tax=Novosphingobium organovorum TaxID=2930092 RepID=A0ABT0BER9_9SPHN|nr:alanine racemase [Novosphingobium organovorum]MCJ2183542.1 alanine racemase [Novosphingobium organovorum]